MKSAIGLDSEKSKLLADKLNTLLANYQLFCINTRGFHWNIRGEKFFELHGKFEELYNDALVKIDEIAEGIRTLDHIPLHSFTAYLRLATIKEADGVTDGRGAMKKVVSGFQILLEKERDVVNLAEDANDERTAALMSDYIEQQEKQVWMHSAYLK